MSNSPVLNLEQLDVETRPPHYNERVEEDRIVNDSRDKVDAWAGHVTASFCSTFAINSGTADTRLAVDDVIGMEYVRSDRVIVGCTAFASMSGSGGVTTVDIQVSSSADGADAAWNSIWTNDAHRPAVSASLGDYGLASSASPVRSGTLRAGNKVRCRLLSAATTLQKNLTVQLWWKPSASYA